MLNKCLVFLAKNNNIVVRKKRLVILSIVLMSIEMKQSIG